MRASIYINEKEQRKFIKYIIGEIAQQFEDKLKNGKSFLEQNIKNYIRTAFYNSEAVKSLINGDLRGQLGLDDQHVANLGQILDKMLENINIPDPEVKRFANYVQINYMWGILQPGYNDLISLPVSSYISEKSGLEISWLSWLIKGCPGVQGYFVNKWDYGDKGNSRSHIAIMFRNKGRSWTLKVDSTVGGLNESDNFLIKIFDGIGDIIAKEVDMVLNA